MEKVALSIVIFATMTFQTLESLSYIFGLFTFKTCSIISERKLWVQMVSQIYIRHVSAILTGKVQPIIVYYTSIRGSKNRLCSDHRNSKDKEKEGKTAAQVDVRPETRSWAMVAIII